MKIGTTPGSGNPDTFAWSTAAGSGYGSEIDITSSNTIEKGITAVFAATTGHGIGNIYSITIGADNKARMIIRTNEGGTVGSTSIHADVSGGAVVTDMVSGGTYTGGPAPVTYYIKVTDHAADPDKFAWSTDNVHYSDPIAMTGVAQTLEKGVTVNWDTIQIGRADGDIYKFIVGADTIQLHSNADFQCAGQVVSENGYIPKILNSDGTVHLNAYS